MKRLSLIALIAVLAISKPDSASAQTPILQPGDQLIATDVVPSSFSSYPAAENPAKAIDGVIPPSGSTDGNKYLNFGRGNARTGSGLIVTPALATTVTGIQLATANDGIGFREPASYALFGTNDVINHSSAATGGADNSDSTQYSWTLISQGSLAPPQYDQYVVSDCEFCQCDLLDLLPHPVPDAPGTDGVLHASR